MTTGVLTTNILNAIEGSFMVSKVSETSTGSISYKDYICVPLNEQDKDGNPIYAKIEVGTFRSKATKTSPAFDVDEGIANFEAHAKAALEKANTPKKSSSGDSEATARQNARKEAIRVWVRNEALVGEAYTATQIFEAVPDVGNAMMAGSCARALVAEGLFDIAKQDGKNVFVVR